AEESCQRRRQLVLPDVHRFTSSRGDTTEADATALRGTCVPDVKREHDLDAPRPRTAAESDARLNVNAPHSELVHSSSRILDTRHVSRSPGRSHEPVADQPA